MTLLNLPIGERYPEAVNAIIEIPAGSVNKYEYDKTLNIFRLDRTLHSPVHYPGDYGFIPSTLGSDGDPLDVLVLVDEPSFVGCLIEVRPIGVLEMLDQGVADQKILAVAVNNARYHGVMEYSDVYPHMLNEIKHFFSIYKDLEGKRTHVGGWEDKMAARELIKSGYEAFHQKDGINEVKEHAGSLR